MYGALYTTRCMGTEQKHVIGWYGKGFACMVCLRLIVWNFLTAGAGFRVGDGATAVHYQHILVPNSTKYLSLGPIPLLTFIYRPGWESNLPIFARLLLRTGIKMHLKKCLKLKSQHIHWDAESILTYRSLFSVQMVFIFRRPHVTLAQFDMHMVVCITDIATCGGFRWSGSCDRWIGAVMTSCDRTPPLLRTSILPSCREKCVVSLDICCGSPDGTTRRRTTRSSAE